MIYQLDEYLHKSSNRKARIALADTLHNIGIISDIEFDILLIEIYINCREKDE